MIKILSKIFLKEAQSIKMIQSSKTKKWLITILCIIAIVAGFASILSPIWLHAEEIKNIIPIDIGYFILIAGFVLSGLTSILSSIGFTYSSGYLDKNLENYIHLPINQKDFVNAKIIVVYSKVLQVTSLMMLPAMILAIAFRGFDIVMILSGVFYTITTPIITTYISIILVGTILYFLNKMKNKSLARNILYGLFTISSMALGFLYNFFTSNIGTKVAEDPTYLKNLYDTVMINSKLIFFYFTWSTEIFTDQKYINILWMILTLIVGYISVLYFQRIYYKGAIGFSSNTNNTKSTKYNKDQVKSRGIIQWFLYREWKQLTKSSVFFFNTIFGNIVIVVMYLGMMFVAYINGGSKISEIEQLVNIFQNSPSDFIPIVLLVSIIVSMFFEIFNTGISTVYSREKDDLEMLKSMPINMKKAFLGKIILHYIIGFSSSFIFFLIPMLFIKIKFIYILTMTIAVLLVNTALIWLPAVYDLRFPTLDWESESMVVKRAKSVWMSMLSSLILNILIIGSIAYMFFVVKFDIKIISGIVCALLLILAIVFYKIYQKLIDKRFK